MVNLSSGEGKGIEGNDRRRSNIYFYLDAPERIHTLHLPYRHDMDDRGNLLITGRMRIDVSVRPFADRCIFMKDSR